MLSSTLRLDAPGRDALVPLALREVIVERLLTLAEGVDAFLGDRRLAGASANTIQSYRFRLRALPEGCVSDLTPVLCRSLLAREIDAGFKLSTVRITHTALMALCRYGVERHWWPESPMQGVPAPNPPPNRHRYLSTDEIRRLWDAAGRTRSKPDELRMILLLLLEGLRVGELCALRSTDIRDGVATVYGKTGHRRVALSPLAQDALRGREGRVVPLLRTSVHQRLAGLGKRAGVAGVHAHAFRHTWTSQALLAGMDMSAVQTLGGWSSDKMVREVYGQSVIEEAAIRESRRVNLTQRLLEP